MKRKELNNRFAESLNLIPTESTAGTFHPISLLQSRILLAQRLKATRAATKLSRNDVNSVIKKTRLAMEESKKDSRLKIER